MRLDDVQAFFRTYYHPANASLALAGDIETARAFDLAEQYFGELAPGPKPERVIAGGSLTREHRLLLEDRVELPRVYMAWHSPAMFADGDAEMDLLADLLANGKTSRLYRTLVYARRIAVDVSAYQGSRELGSYFLIAATAAPGQSLTDITSAIDAELQTVIDKGPSAAEMQRAAAQIEAHFLYRLQTVGGFGGKSDQLNAYNTYCGDPAYFSRDVARYREATEERVRAAAARLLRFDARVLLSVVPHGSEALALAGSERIAVS